jgi:hypothetical protein
MSTACTARSGNFFGHADDVADGNVGVESEQQIRRGQVEEM